MFPKATYPLTPAQLSDAIAQRSGSTVVEGNGLVLGFANFYKAEHGGICALGNVVVAPPLAARAWRGRSGCRASTTTPRVCCFIHSLALYRLASRSGRLRMASGWRWCR